MPAERWLLDTNVVSELARPQPDAGVLAFVSAMPSIVLASVVLYELERGVLNVPSGKRRRDLERWLATLLEGPIEVVALDADAARAAARIETRAAVRGRPIDPRDALIAGTARAHGFGLATRNLAHFRGHGVRLVDPFER